ncbi:hypothetical protein BDW59DRAFT_140256 [Aspergillus cavernicola]|uniref:Zn(2)-C6 fungal-type domain-containing protein n=1 Tax=Aspergillus cavernicola TaxID=176166 RepID=A0ABR4IXJ8_9EURO
MPKPDHSHSKYPQMRLGTRSCTECRRRKIRCIYPPHGNLCQQCEAHGTPCQKQEARRAAPPRNTRGSDGVLHERIENLERIVSQIYETRHVAFDAATSAQEMNSIEALKYLCPNADMGTNGHQTVDLDDADGQLDGPLLDLLNRSLSIEKAMQPRTRPIHPLKSVHAIQALQALKLCADDLNLVLRMTEKYWALWPILPPGFIQIIPSPLGLEIQSATNFINDSLQSESPEVVAKAFLWLALCIQQLPSNFDHYHHNLPCSRASLLQAYLKGAEELLGSPHDAQEDSTFLECLLLQAKLYINMGKPRKSWLAVRHAINLALLQGIQSTHGPDSEKMKLIWLQLWIFDQQLSMFMGLPHSIPDSHPSVSSISDDVLHQYLYCIGIISGHIGDRNLNIVKADWSDTLNIERELVHMREMMPVEWDLPNGVELSVADVWGKQIGKFYYYVLLMNTYLPYILQEYTHGETHTHSRTIALMASRKMIEHYHGLRHSTQGELLICDLMDFQVFSAAIVLVINVLSPTTERNIEQDMEDWSQISGLRQTLDRLSQAMTCSVAKQAADLLNYLYAAGHGTYRDEPYEAVIPYFGRVRISPPKNDMKSMSSTNTDPASAVNLVEFSAQSLSPQGPDTLGYYFGDSELSADWSMASDFDFNWDWNEVFTIPI